MPNKPNFFIVSILLIASIMISIILTIVLSKISKKYRNKSQYKPRLQKKWEIAVYKGILGKFALFFCTYIFVSTMASYIFIQRDYKSNVIVFFNVIINVISMGIIVSLLFPFNFMGKHKNRVFLKILVYTILVIASQLLISNNTI